MRRQISLLVAVISTAIVASFVIPLLLLVSTLAEDRGMGAATQQANAVAMLVAGLHDSPRLADALQPSLTGSPAAVSVVLPGGNQVGVPWPDFGSDPSYQRAQLGQAFTVRDASGGHIYQPVLIEQGVAVIRATVTPAQLSEGVPLAWLSVIAVGLLLSGVAILVAAQVGRGVSRPLLAVAETAHRLREGDLDARAPLAGPPETRELGSALNRLAERVDQLLVAERDSVRGLAHRLRTPVTALRLEAEQVSDPKLRTELADSIGELQVAIDGIVREARQPLREGLLPGSDALRVVTERVAYWRPLAEDQGRTVSVDLPDQPLPVRMSELELGDVIDICIDNIFAHTDEGANFGVRLEERDGQAVLIVTDSGAGFPQNREAPPRGTSGMGLRLARRAVTAAGGTLTTSAPGRIGAEVRISLPPTGEAASR